MNDENMTTLAGIRAFDAKAADTWFKPIRSNDYGACGQAFVNQRDLLSRLDLALGVMLFQAVQCHNCGGSGMIRCSDDFTLDCAACHSLRAAIAEIEK